MIRWIRPLFLLAILLAVLAGVLWIRREAMITPGESVSVRLELSGEISQLTSDVRLRGRILDDPPKAGPVMSDLPVRLQGSSLLSSLEFQPGRLVVLRLDQDGFEFSPDSLSIHFGKVLRRKDARVELRVHVQPMAPGTDVVAVAEDESPITDPPPPVEDPVRDPAPPTPGPSPELTDSHDPDARSRDEDERQEEAKRLEDERKRVEEAKRLADEQKRMEEAKRLEDERKRMEEAKRLEEEQKRMEEAKRLEDERKRMEEAKRLEDERKRVEEAKRLEDERKRMEEAKRLEDERKRMEEAKRLEEELLDPERSNPAELPSTIPEERAVPSVQPSENLHYIRLAEELYQKGDFDGVLGLEIPEPGRDSPSYLEDRRIQAQMLEYRACAMMSKKDLAGAVDAFEEIVAANPRSGVSQFNLLVCLYRLKRYDDVIHRAYPDLMRRMSTIPTSRLRDILSKASFYQAMSYLSLCHADNMQPRSPNCRRAYRELRNFELKWSAEAGDVGIQKFVEAARYHLDAIELQGLQD